MRTDNLLLTAIAFLGLCSATVSAQDTLSSTDGIQNQQSAEESPLPDTIPDAASIAIPNEVVVTATRKTTVLRNTPGINYVLDKRSIESTNPKTTSDILEYAPGLDVSAGTGVGSPGKKTFSINGTPTFHNVILVDGKRLLSSHFHTGIDVNLVPAQNIERIEIVKDASSALYGSDALGGVINIISKRGKNKPELSASTSTGSQNTHRGAVSVSGPAAPGILHSTYAGYEESDGLPIETARRAGKLNYKQFSLMERIDAKIADRITLSPSIIYVTQNDLKNPSDNLKYDATIFTPGIDANLRLTDDFDLDILSYYTRWSADLSRENHEYATPQIMFTWRGLDKHTLTLGTEAAWRNFSREGVTEKAQKSGAFFIQDNMMVMENLQLLGALRADYLFNKAAGAEDIGPTFSPKLSLLYRPIKQVGIRAGGGLGFRAPNVQDLYESRFHSSSGGIWRYGNVALKPEYSRNASFGIEIEPISRLAIVANGFASNLTDMIAVLSAGRDTVYRTSKGVLDTVPVLQRQNVSDFSIQSVELYARYTTKYLLTEFGGSATWQESGDENSKDALTYPGQSIRCKLAGFYPVFNHVRLTGFVGIKSSFSRKSPTGIALRDYNDIEAGLGCKLFGRYELYAKGLNLLEEKIELYEDALITIRGIRRYEAGVSITMF